MESQVVSHARRFQGGFTLTEVILVLALISVVSFTVVPVSVVFYKSQLLDQSAEDIEQTLRRAQLLSMSGRNESAYGVRLMSDTYVLFAGESYLSRQTELDEVYPLVGAITISGPSEIVFSRVFGEPSEYESVTVTLDNKVSVIEIKPSGDIEY